MDADTDDKPARRPGAAAERVFAALLSRLEAGALTVTWPDGRTTGFAGPGPGPRADLHIRHRRFFRQLLPGGSMGFAEAYMRGDCDSRDLTALITLAIANRRSLLPALAGHRWLRGLWRLGHRLRPNSRPGARRNIARHYDLGNDFYACWLDPSMTYSSAVFASPHESLSPDESLEAAQIRKYRHLAQLAGLRAGERVLEIGCGWGGFCLWAARTIGCHVTAITISPAQYNHVARCVQAGGLAHRVAPRLHDYRDLRGRFDRIVSIEMLEAVGEPYWPRYFDKLHECLSPGGRVALQVLTIADELFPAYRRNVDFIQRHIFPGGMLPSRRRLRDQVARSGLVWRRDGRFGAHYARTLAIWRRNFEAAWPRIGALGFDERFRRMWRYYLSYCEAGFADGRIDVLQIALARP